MEDDVGFPEAAMRHLEGRQRLEEKLFERLEHARAFAFRERLLERGGKRARMQRRHVEDAEALGQRLPAELMRARQRRLFGLGEVMLQRDGVLDHQIRTALSHIPPPR